VLNEEVAVAPKEAYPDDRPVDEAFPFRRRREVVAL
jgi:hypothetical protein